MREQLIAMGYSRSEVAELPDSYVSQLVRMLSVAQPETRERCPECGAETRYLGGRLWNCDITSCQMGSFTEAK